MWQGGNTQEDQRPEDMQANRSNFRSNFRLGKNGYIFVGYIFYPSIGYIFHPSPDLTFLTLCN